MMLNIHEFYFLAITGNFNWISRENMVLWNVELIDRSGGEDELSGQLEFVVSSGGQTLSKENFFPIMVRFRVDGKTACPLVAKAAKGPDGVVPLHTTRQLTATYEIAA